MARVAGLAAVLGGAFAASYLLFTYGPGLLDEARPVDPPGMVWIPGGEVTMNRFTTRGGLDRGDEVSRVGVLDTLRPQGRGGGEELGLTFAPRLWHPGAVHLEGTGL